MKQVSSDQPRIFSALIVPMNADESIDYHSLDELVEWQLQNGVEGFYCCGSSGEGLLLSLEEREYILERVVRKVNKRVPVIAHVGTLRTADTIRLAHHAQNLEADAISMIPPYYYKFCEQEITEYYKEVVRSVPGISVLIYNIPQFTGIEFNRENISELFQEDDIVGIKHTSKDLYSMERIHAAFPEKKIYNGFDEQFLAALSMGADATIGTAVNIYPGIFKKISSLYKTGDMKNALKFQQELNRRIEVLCKCGIFNSVKYILSKNGICCGKCRKPFQQLTENQKDMLDRII